MTRIDKEALKAKKEESRAIQYPRKPEPQFLDPEQIVTVKVGKKKAKKSTK